MESLFLGNAKLWAKQGTLNGEFGNDFQSSVAFSIAGHWFGTTLFVWPLRCASVGCRIQRIGPDACHLHHSLALWQFERLNVVSKLQFAVDEWPIALL